MSFSEVAVSPSRKNVSTALPASAPALSNQVLIFSLLLILGGCATTSPQPRTGQPAGTPAPERTVEVPPQPSPGAPMDSPQPRPRQEPDASAATLALLQQSERAASSGSLTEAISYAERAVRINPRQADLWTRLADLELQNRHPQTAIQYATKAISLAGSRTDWQRDAWLLIAAAKESLGEHDEARTIRERWKSARG
ncbi:MAG: hypothetical protein R3E82_00860 [Pseudomonadales bacterium]